MKKYIANQEGYINKLPFESMYTNVEFEKFALLYVVKTCLILIREYVHG